METGILSLSFAMSKDKKQIQTGSPVTKQKNSNQKNTIMKTMEFTTTTVAQFENEAMAEKFKKSLKRALTNTFKFLLFISPVYPQCTQGMK